MTREIKDCNIFSCGLDDYREVLAGVINREKLFHGLSIYETHIPLEAKIPELCVRLADNASDGQILSDIKVSLDCDQIIIEVDRRRT